MQVLVCHAEQSSDLVAPEFGYTDNDATTPQPSNQTLFKRFVVSAANPIASKAAYTVLKNGGNAIDAMVTVQTVLGLVEPQSSGLGGGSFLVYYNAKDKSLTTFDGRETAPIQANEQLFIVGDEPMKFFDAVVGGRSVGTPGTVKLLWDTHQRFGNTSWSDLLSPAIKLADKGFLVSPRMANAISNDRFLQTHPETKQYFYPSGEALKQGSTLKNPKYRETLQALAKHGGDFFYDSFISQSIVNTVQNSSSKGLLTHEDFTRYKVLERKAVCGDYRQYEVCGMGPPSSGAITVAQILGILQSFDLSSSGPKSALSWNLISEASRLAFADRGMYIADPDFSSLPKGLLAEQYLSRRAQLIIPNKATDKITAGQPDQTVLSKYQVGISPEQNSTTHFVIVDLEGNIVSMTSSIENGFGSRLMSNGFLLNNQLTDFSFRAKESNGKLIANRVAPQKRPRSSMAPTILLKDGKPFLALGSPGGSRIINYVSNAIIGVVDWGLTLQQSFDQPHIINRFGTMDLEEGSAATSYIDEFESMGYNTSVRNLNSGLQGVLFTAEGMVGAADKRREGLSLGE